MRPKKHNAKAAARSLALLWGPRTEEGHSGLSLETMIAAAIVLADAEGLDALSMRRLAERLGVGAMSLYTYIPGKADLVALMEDAAYGQLYASTDQPSRQEGDWKEGLRFVARRNWDLFMKHPWLLELTSGRPALGPNALLKYEAELRPLEGIGLEDLDMDAALTLVLTHVEGCARSKAAMDRTSRESGQSDAEWWLTQGPALAKVVDATRFPVASRVGSASGMAYEAASSPERLLSFGLERILEGLKALVS